VNVDVINMENNGIKNKGNMKVHNMELILKDNTKLK
jgi:hypothetical protein